MNMISSIGIVQTERGAHQAPQRSQHTRNQTVMAPHPYAPLTAAEVAAASAAAIAHAASLGLPPLRFNTVALHEPPKRLYLQQRAAGLPTARQASCIMQTPPAFHVFEAVINVGQGRPAAIEDWRKLDGDSLDGQPLASPDDCLACHHPIPKGQMACLQRTCARLRAVPHVSHLLITLFNRVVYNII